MASDTEITKVRIVIRHLLWQIREVRKDRDAAWKWVNRFANTLQYQELEQDPDQYALAILAEARSFNDQQRRKGQMLGVRKQLAKEGVTSPTQEQLDEKWLEMYGQETTADASTREGEDERDHRGNTGNLESSSSANHYGVAPHREAGDVSATDSNISQDAPNGNAGDERRSGSNSVATVNLVHPAPNMRRAPQNEAPAHGFSGGRTAQGTMSRSPEAAAQSGKAYDQETDQVSTDKARQSQALESRRTGGSSARGMAKVAQPPVRSSGPMPADVQKVYDFASLEGLDKDDAYECWYVTTAERDGNDADGNPVTNWKAFVRTWCNTRRKKRSA